MATTIHNFPREFRFGDQKLPDPNPNISPKEVARIYSNQYPELTTANIVGPELKEEKAVYTFESSFKPKG